MTIPKDIRQEFGIRKGSKINVAIVDEHIELYVSNIIPNIPSTGYAMLQSKCKAIPADFDPACLLNNDQT